MNDFIVINIAAVKIIINIIINLIPEENLFIAIFTVIIFNLNFFIIIRKQVVFIFILN